MKGTEVNRGKGRISEVRFFVFLMIVVITFPLGIACKNTIYSADMNSLKRINAEMAETARLDKKLRKETLSRKELRQIDPNSNLRLEDPAPIKEILDNRYIDLGNDFFSHLESSQINKMGKGTRQEQKLFKAQNILRYETMSIFMKKLYRMDERQTEYYYTWIKNLSPDGVVQMNYMKNIGNLAYYKNIPELTGRTLDKNVSIFFTVKIQLGYELGEQQTQTILNKNKYAMSDTIRKYFSSRYVIELESKNENLLKAQLRVLLNRQVLKYDKSGELDGIEDVSIVALQNYQL